MPTPTKRPKNRKAQIALAAAELFCARGYHGVGVDEIAGAVGITGPAIYRHFPNKYAMLVHATRELTVTIRAATDRALAESTDPREKLDHVLDALATLSVEQRRVGGLYQWENRYLEPEHRAEFRAGLNTLIGRIAEPLSVIRPELPPRAPRLLTRAAFSALASPATHRAPISRSRAVDLLRRAGWALLTADVPAALPAPAAPAPRDATRPGATRPTDAQPTTDSPTDARPAPEDAGPRDARREAVLATAIRLFHQHGYHAVGMEDIGKASGLHASSLYRYFPSKADLLAAAYHRAAEQVTSNTTASLEAAATDEEGLRRLVEGFVDLTFGQRDLVAVYLAENNNLPDRDRHELRKIQRLQVDEWVRLLVGVRPELAASEARILVHASLNLVTDLGGATDPSPPDSFRPLVAALALRLMRQA
ncbi:TetR/AcrR family transcriptional regulator [Cryptosporangium sp. NPDC048952]|uniref:TetR/AcrR family transcriptional regulator n=1 Tax=Cryptosporangium sp. NPDC048952 TaxID=3363961 RepID=UPI00371EAC1E